MKTITTLLFSAILTFNAANVGAHHEGEAKETKLKGGEIHALLAGNTAYLDNGAVQSFTLDGGTIYKAASGHRETGSWRIEGDRYCSEWSGRWSCYEMTGNGAQRITWLQTNSHYSARLEAGEALQ